MYFASAIESMSYGPHDMPSMAACRLERSLTPHQFAEDLDLESGLSALPARCIGLLRALAVTVGRMHLTAWRAWASALAAMHAASAVRHLRIPTRLPGPAAVRPAARVSAQPCPNRVHGVSGHCGRFPLWSAFIRSRQSMPTQSRCGIINP